jgi:hypothetical protein
MDLEFNQITQSIRIFGRNWQRIIRVILICFLCGSSKSICYQVLKIIGIRKLYSCKISRISLTNNESTHYRWFSYIYKYQGI